MVEIRPVVGHHSAWGLGGGSQARIEPYKLTPGAIDTMCVRVREKLDIYGIGLDVVEMEGSFTVRRDHPCSVGEHAEPRWGESCVKTEFRSLELSGHSPLFGTVRVHLDPEFASYGEVAPAEDGSLAADCVAHCYPTVELPELGMTLTTNGQPVQLASKVVQIPPVGDVARSDNSAQLVDEVGSVLGSIVSSDIEVGDLVCSFPLGSTAGRGDSPHHHPTGEHPDPSGPHFYAEAPREDQLTPKAGQPLDAAMSEGAPHEHFHDHGQEPAGVVREHSAATAPAGTSDLREALHHFEQDLTSLASLLRSFLGEQAQ